MAIRVVTGNNTLIKKVTVGTPIRRVTAGGFTISNLGGVDVTGVSDGAMLVYNDGTENFEATTNIDNANTNLNGGNF